MSFSKKLFRSPRSKGIAVIGGALFALAMLAAPQQAAAQTDTMDGTCDINSTPSFNGPTPLFNGDTVTIQVELTSAFDFATFQRTEVPTYVHSIANVSDGLEFPNAVGDYSLTNCRDASDAAVSVSSIDTNTLNLLELTFNNPIVWDENDPSNCVIEYDVVIPNDNPPGLITSQVGQGPGSICVDEEEEPSPDEQTANLNFEIETCVIAVDKRVACVDGFFLDVTGDDDTTGETTEGCISWNGFAGMDPEQVTHQYFGANLGTVDASDCTLMETNGRILMIDGAIVEVNAGNLPLDSGAFDPLTLSTLVEEVPIDNPKVNDCSEALVEFEGDGNTATLECTCREATAEFEAKTATATDTAVFDCQTPGLGLMAACEVTQDDPPSAVVSITEIDTSTFDADFEMCEATAQFFGLDPMEDCTDVDFDTEDPLMIMVASLDLGDIMGSMGSFDPMAVFDPVELSQSVCAKVTISCDIAGSGAIDEECAVQNECNILEDPERLECLLANDCVVPKTFMAMDASECIVEEGGCITRTPGFWCSKDTATDNVIAANGGAVESCGVLLDNTTAANPTSALEDLASVSDHKDLDGIGPQQLQLERQCAAANLNLAVSAAEELFCDAAFDVDEEPTAIMQIVDACCNAEDSVCRTATSEADVTTSGCIGVLDEFNNEDFPDDNISELLSGFRATPSDCQDSRNNGWANGRGIRPDPEDVREFGGVMVIESTSDNRGGKKKN